MNWFLFWLFLHILAAVLAFGPTFVFPIIGIQAQRNPQNVHFAMVLNEKIERGLVIPLALTMLVGGTGLLFAANVDVPRPPSLGVAIALSLTARGLARGGLAPPAARLGEMPAQWRAPAPAAGAGGPPPE